MSVATHLRTVMKHKWLVFVHSVRAGIPLQGLVHDISKFSPTEFIPGAKFSTGKKSPIPAEREQYGFSKAWVHHKAKNKHHVEYWTDYDAKKGGFYPVEIPVKYMVEMFCDMLAANKVYMGKDHKDDDAIKYFYDKHMKEQMHEKSANMLEVFFTVLAQKGEKEAFRYVRKVKKQKRL